MNWRSGISWDSTSRCRRGWNGRVWYAMTNDQNLLNTRGTVNKSAVSAALGWTVNATAATGTDACHRHLDQAEQRSLSESVLRRIGLHVQFG